jgi:phage tail-like protein
MVEFTVNPQRRDPYKNFKFKVKWDGKYVAGLSKMGPLKRATEVLEYREGGDSSVVRKLPGRTRYSPITLEAGVTHDTAFEDWANLANSTQGDSKVSIKNFRKDITIDVFDEQGNLALSYRAYRCWVSEYQALPEMDANVSAVAISSIKIENEGWERDTSVTEPSEH